MTGRSVSLFFRRERVSSFFIRPTEAGSSLKASTIEMKLLDIVEAQNCMYENACIHEWVSEHFRRLSYHTHYTQFIIRPNIAMIV